MDAHEPVGTQDIVEAILEHLRDNALAADSVEGVARWWLKRCHANAGVEEVQAALDLLVARGVLRRVQLGVQEPLYSQLLAQRH